MNAQRERHMNKRPALPVGESALPSPARVGLLLPSVIIQESATNTSTTKVPANVMVATKAVTGDSAGARIQKAAH
jgi:hypothetical protein